MLIEGALTGFRMFAFFVVSHWIIFGLFRPKNRSRVLFRTTLFFWILILLRFYHPHYSLGSFGMEIFVVQVTGATLSFACMWFLYMPFYYSIQTSISVGMLIRILQSGSAGFPVLELKPEAGTKFVVKQRLETMVVAGYVTTSPDGYRLTDKGRYVAHCFRTLKKFWKLGAGG